VQQKREVEKAQEQTTPMRAFLPTTDIYETEDALTVVLEMPGVDRDNIEVNVENGVLTVEGKINFGKYEGLQPIYSEYNIGPYKLSAFEPGRPELTGLEPRPASTQLGSSAGNEKGSESATR
jgi:hypothetical protein